MIIIFRLGRVDVYGRADAEMFLYVVKHFERVLSSIIVADP